ncbi:patatin-like phospholipase family protein [Paraburkholderia ferrariae]|uniref:patatin-like phospholipase family protein n=1 Tax=Paraburkholderia ferrariae TaxID=386056 RepID=UPI000481B3AA|nr:patatin-like phospholipase family protein [Paraburkholderia ferrariae]
MRTPIHTDTHRDDTPPSSGWRVPADFLAKELDQVNRYRKAVETGKPATRTDETLGLAISGGGIRSAIFALGVLQALASKDALRRFDYLSTVSGGSYIGAFYGSLFVSEAARKDDPAVRDAMNDAAMAKIAQAKLASTIQAHRHDDANAAAPLEYLRDNCDYLTPNGTTDLLQSLAFTVRNWFALQYVIGTALVGVLLLVALLTWWLAKHASWWPQHLSSIALVPVLIAALAISPLSRAYWLTQNKGRQAESGLRNLPFVTLALTFCLGLSLAYACRAATITHWDKEALLLLFGYWLMAGSVLGLIAYEYVHYSVCFHWPPQGDAANRNLSGLWQALPSGNVARNSRQNFEKIRNQLANGYTAALRPFQFGLVQWMLLTLVLAIVDSAGSALASFVLQFKASSFSLTAMGSIATFVGSNGLLATLTKSFALKATPPTGRGKEGSTPRLPLFVIASVAAVLVTLLTLIFWSASAHVIVSLLNFTHDSEGHGYYFLALWIFFLAVALIDGYCFQFLNMSSYHRLYSVRLTRTFLGATNPYRQKKPDRRNLTELMPGDNIAMRDYFSPQICAPVHIINSTINKTVDWDSSLVQRHARGLPFGISPVGMTIGQQFGTVEWDWTRSDDASTVVTRPGASGNYSVESLTLGDWVGISGAAVSTGLGQTTNPAYSILLGAANVRLGYWWDTRSPTVAGVASPDAIPVAPPEQLLGLRLHAPIFGTQTSLLDELLGRFDGPRARYWYLTDGGHYENTGAYELIRRGLKYIVVLDNGCDLDNHFGDLANLIEHVRVDFGIDIVEASVSAPPRLPLTLTKTPAIATSFAQFASSGQHCGVQLTVLYPGGEKGNLLALKPRLIDGVPYDLVEYQMDQRPSFPQETTADQFFDTVQWEAHRALGFHIGSVVFAQQPPDHAHPSEGHATAMAGPRDGA